MQQAPKGRKKLAQGKALGKEIIGGKALKGRSKRGVAPSGLRLWRNIFPGRCPGLTSFAPLGLRQIDPAEGKPLENL